MAMSVANCLFLELLFLASILYLVHAQNGFYDPFQIQARNRNPYPPGYFNPNHVPLPIAQAARRADTCASSPGSQCMFVLLCLMAGGTSSGICSGGGLLSTCCVLPPAQGPPAPAPQAAPSRAWAPTVSHNAIRTSDLDRKPARFNQNAVVKTTKAPANFSYCGVAQAKPQSRIIGGNDAMYGEFPWQAHIKLNRQQCGGVLLNNFYVLTAAHCIYQVRLSDIVIKLGVYDIQDSSRQSSAPQIFSVVEKKVHPNFKYEAAHPDRYDVALLKLDRAAKFQENVVPICLPPKGWDFTGWKGMISGWGKTDSGLSNRFGTRILQKVDVPIISNEKCEKWHHEKGIDITISSEMMCAGYEHGQKDACVGDSGGPLMVVMQGRWTVAGLVSAGFGCAQSKQPGIYHRVPHTVDWVIGSIRS